MIRWYRCICSHVFSTDYLTPQHCPRCGGPNIQPSAPPTFGA